MYTKKFITEGLDKSKKLIWDTETIGLYGKTRLVQVRQGEVSYVYDLFYINVEEIKYFFKDWSLIMHNSHYDLSCKEFMRWVPKDLDDTMVAARLAWPGWDSHSLFNVAKNLKLGVKGDEGASDWSRWKLTDEQLHYAEMDTYFTEEIYKRIPQNVLESTVYKLDIANIKLAVDYQYRGMQIAHSEASKYVRKLKSEMKQVKTLPADINVNSSKQVKDFLKIDSSDKQTLKEMATQEAKDIMTMRRCMKAISYVESLQPYHFATAITNPAAAKTGRFTSKSSTEIPGTFNLQQIPRDMKSLFGANEGFYVTADYPALEIWMCAAIIGDDAMCNALRHKLDLHKDTAMRMFNMKLEDISKEDRSCAKLCNFTLLYGAGYKTLGAAFVGEGKPEFLNKAQDLRMKWRKAYPTIAEWQDEIFEYFNTHDSRICYTPLGRPIKAKTPMECMNFSVQGGGAECTKLALVLLDKEDIKICNTVHDSIALMAQDEEEANYLGGRLAYAVEEAYRRVIKSCKVNDLSLSVEVNINKFYS